MDTSTLIPRQALALRFIIDRLQADGFPPTLAEIAVGVGGCSRSNAKLLVAALGRAGYLEVTPGCARGIRVLKDEAGRAVTHRWNVVTDLGEVRHA